MREAEYCCQAYRDRCLEELRELRKRGVRVLIDGVEKPESGWSELFGVCDDGGFYMGDYILGKEEREEKEVLKEIRFDKVRQ